MNRSNKEMLPPHLEVRFLHAQMILELGMHIAYGDLDLNPNFLAMFGLRHIFLRYSRYRSACERSSEMLAVVIVNRQTASEVSKTKWLLAQCACSASQRVCEAWSIIWRFDLNIIEYGQGLWINELKACDLEVSRGQTGLI
jgi:hypothetical protein